MGIPFTAIERNEKEVKLVQGSCKKKIKAIHTSLKKNSSMETTREQWRQEGGA